MGKLRCEECGKIFTNRRTLQKHAKLDHDHEVEFSRTDVELSDLFSGKKLLKGAAIGFLLTAVLIAGFVALQELDSDSEEAVEITVLTCENCSYQQFQNTTGAIFDVKYRELPYNSTEGEELIQRYDIGYIPAFIFDTEVEDRANFTRINSTLKNFDHAYVLPDGRMPAAQRVSSGGFELR